MPIHETRALGALQLELFTQLTSQIAFSDFCVPAGTLEFSACDSFLDNSFALFKLSYPGFTFEAHVHDGMVFVRRNGIYQHSEQFRSRERLHVAIQWNIDSIGCGVVPWSEDPDRMNGHLRSVHTPITLPPIELVRILRSNNLLVNSAYPTLDDLFVTVLDCLHLSELDIRRHGSERFVWGKNGDPKKPLDEPEISRFLASFLGSHGAARNFDVTCEPIAGSGNIDFYIVAPIAGSGLGKIAIEAKKANHAKLEQGFRVQLPEYMTRIGTSYGIFLTYWLKSDNYPYPSQDRYTDLEIEILHPISRPPTVRTVGIDLSNGPTPSKR